MFVPGARLLGIAGFMLDSADPESPAGQGPRIGQTWRKKMQFQSIGGHYPRPGLWQAYRCQTGILGWIARSDDFGN